MISPVLFFDLLPAITCGFFLICVILAILATLLWRERQERIRLAAEVDKVLRFISVLCNLNMKLPQNIVEELQSFVNNPSEQSAMQSTSKDPSGPLQKSE